MTTPRFNNSNEAEGLPIGILDVNVEIGNWNSSTGQQYQLGLDWIRDHTRTTRGGAVNVISDMDNVHDKGYYPSTMEGNCNNANAGNCNCNCGNKNCGNCTNCNAINCVNCDGATYYLQPNCNCNCTYNCNVNSVTINCDCDCFVCNCW